MLAAKSPLKSTISGNYNMLIGNFAYQASHVCELRLDNVNIHIYIYVVDLLYSLYLIFSFMLQWCLIPSSTLRIPFSCIFGGINGSSLFL